MKKNEFEKTMREIGAEKSSYDENIWTIKDDIESYFSDDAYFQEDKERFYNYYNGMFSTIDPYVLVTFTFFEDGPTATYTITDGYTACNELDDDFKGVINYLQKKE